MVYYQQFSLITIQLAGIIFGLVNGFFGYRIFKVLIGIWGFFTGVSLGLYASAQVGLSGPAQWILAILAGILAMVVMILLYYAGVFLLGILLGLILLDVMSFHVPFQLTWIWLAGAGLLGGICALLVQKPVLIIGTAYAGAWLTVLSIMSYILHVPPWLLSFPGKLTGPDGLYALVGWLVLGTLGMAVQIGQSKDHGVKSG
jgi:Domain of unknown function (DUF4203)